MTEAVTLNVDSGVATLRLNRAEHRNAMNTEMIEVFRDHLKTIQEAEVRVMVLEGAGEAFCAGGDVQQITSAHAEGYNATEYYEMIDRTFNELMLDLATLPLPTVAKVDGIAFGGGANLAIACDVQIATKSAQISFGFEQLGLTVDTGTSFLLPRLVGINRALDLVYTGKKVSAERAEEIGLFTHVYPPDEFDARFDDYVDSVAAGPPLAYEQSKWLLRNGIDSTLEEALHNEATAQATLLGSEDHQRALEAVFGHSEAQFQGR